MSEKVKIYHNNRCSKSRGALTLLQARGIDFETVHYLDQPPSFVELKEIFAMLGLDSVRGMMRTKDDLYHELGLADESLSNDALLKMIAEHPALLERPIVLVGKKAAIGRPLENIEAILS